jgi:diguanylate cyclase (GGDEF)-like protein
MMKSGAKAIDLDMRLRAVQGRSDKETIQKCLAELIEDCETYLAEQGEAAERFGARIDELGELRSLGEEVELANMEQAAQVETTLNNLRFMDFESDVEAANLRLVEEIKNLRAARHKLRDDQERAFLVIAQYENRMSKIDERLFHDPLTKLRNRIGLETTLWEWWQEGRHRSRPMSAALFDLDAFGKLNEIHGLFIAERILHEIGRFIEKKAGESDLAGRYSGQRFLLVMVDVGPQGATKNAEFIRQSIERITFLQGEKEIRVTARGGFTEVKPDDTHEELFGRLEQALKQAKADGPNRSFRHDGKTAEFIESPNLGAKYVEIPV